MKVEFEVKVQKITTRPDGSAKWEIVFMQRTEAAPDLTPILRAFNPEAFTEKVGG